LREQFNYFSQSTTGLANLSESLLDEMIFIRFSYREQQAIVEFLDYEISKIDNLINKIQLQNQKLQEFRQSLISNVVTGKIKV